MRRFDGFRLAMVAVGIATCAFLVVPIVCVVILSFSAGRYLEWPPPGWSLQWYRSALQAPIWRYAFRDSFIVATAVMVIATLLGVPAGIAAARGSMPIRGAIIVAMTAPILVPVVSQGVSYYALFARLGLIDTYAGLVIAHAALAIPVVVMNAWAAARQVDATLEDAARSLGASFGRSYFYVTLPLIRHGIVAGGILAFMTSFDESVLSLFLAGSHVATIPKRMWDGLQFALDPTVSAVGVLLVSLAALTIGTVFCYARIVE